MKTTIAQFREEMIQLQTLETDLIEERKRQSEALAQNHAQSERLERLESERRDMQILMSRLRKETSELRQTVIRESGWNGSARLMVGGAAIGGLCTFAVLKLRLH